MSYQRDLSFKRGSNDIRLILKATLRNAIIDSQGVDEVHFDPDGLHVYIGPVDGKLVRYRLGPDAQQWLAGELGMDVPESGLNVTLCPPGGAA